MVYSTDSNRKRSLPQPEGVLHEVDLSNAPAPGSLILFFERLFAESGFPSCGAEGSVETLARAVLC
jgi:hypothetical protein